MSSSVQYLSEDVPLVVIDYADLVAKTDLSASIDAGYGANGLGILAVKNIPDFAKLRGELLPISRQFALLPDQIKDKYVHPESHYSFGWSHGVEVLAKGQPDLAKGSFYANPICDNPVKDPELIKKYPSFYTANIWPKEDLPQLEPAFKALGRRMMEVGRLVMWQADKLVKKVNPNYQDHRQFDILTKSLMAKGRLLHYFAQDKPKEGGAPRQDSWCGWHNDHGSLTALCPAMFLDANGDLTTNKDPKAGLYIYSRTGEMVRANGVPKDYLLFQIGETAQVHSGGVLQATPHAVFGGDNPGVSRETFAVFMEPQHAELMNIPDGADLHATQHATTSEFLPKQVPPLSKRYEPSDDFAAFTQRTLSAYHS